MDVKFPIHPRVWALLSPDRPWIVTDPDLDSVWVRLDDGNEAKLEWCRDQEFDRRYGHVFHVSVHKVVGENVIAEFNAFECYSPDYPALRFAVGQTGNEWWAIPLHLGFVYYGEQKEMHEFQRRSPRDISGFLHTIIGPGQRLPDVNVYVRPFPSKKVFPKFFRVAVNIQFEQEGQSRVLEGSLVSGFLSGLRWLVAVEVIGKRQLKLEIHEEADENNNPIWHVKIPPESLEKVYQSFLDWIAPTCSFLNWTRPICDEWDCWAKNTAKLLSNYCGLRDIESLARRYWTREIRVADRVVEIWNRHAPDQLAKQMGTPVVVMEEGQAETVMAVGRPTKRGFKPGIGEVASYIKSRKQLVDSLLNLGYRELLLANYAETAMDEYALQIKQLAYAFECESDD